MILVVAEHAAGRLGRSTYEMAGAARALEQGGREGPVTILVLGSGVAAAANAAARLAEQVLVGDRPELAEYDAEVWAAAVAQIAREGDAGTVLIAGSRSGREYSPRVAVKLDAALVEDAVSLTVAESAVAGGALRAVHYTHLARVTETVETDGTVVVTVKPVAFAPAAELAVAGEQYDVELELPARRMAVTGRTAEGTGRVSLGEAEVVVAGGRGVGSAEAFETLVVGLADALGGAVGATRAVVDAGWRPYSEQVGQTGKTVQPKMYVAVGISGAVQHLSGMGKSKVVVAINRDAEAPIFKESDYGVVGDVAAVIPALVAELRKTV